MKAGAVVKMAVTPCPNGWIVSIAWRELTRCQWRCVVLEASC